MMILKLYDIRGPIVGYSSSTEPLVRYKNIYFYWNDVLCNIVTMWKVYVIQIYKREREREIFKREHWFVISFYSSVLRYERKTTIAENSTNVTSLFLHRTEATKIKCLRYVRMILKLSKVTNTPFNKTCGPLGIAGFFTKWFIVYTYSNLLKRPAQV